MRKAGTIGGDGSIALPTEVFGTMAPGDDNIGTLHIADYVKGTNPTLTLRPTAILNMKIRSANYHDAIEVEGNVAYNNIDENFNTSDKMPRVVIHLT